MFRGRENDHPELGMKILDRVITEVEEVAKVEATPKRDGRNMVMVLAPDKVKIAATAKAATKADKADKADRERASRDLAAAADGPSLSETNNDDSPPAANGVVAEPTVQDSPATTSGAGAEATTA